MDEYRAAQQRLAAQLVQQETSTATPPQAGASGHDEYIEAQRRLAVQLMQQEHSYPFTVPSPQTQSQPQARRPPPPLPPRENSSYNAEKVELYSSHRPSYTSSTSSYLQERGRAETMSSQWQPRDPRSSSMQSLRPVESHHGRRTLLLIYIHGFMGNETSFQSFPAHLHSLLTRSMQESHVVHSKIYPRYKSRKAIEFARDDFSRWLSPHENENTDIVLLGHSMGGILAAEVCLNPPEGHTSSPPFKHRILGEICFDTPFLGMHPGLVGSGIASLFRPSPPPPGSVAQNDSAGDSSSSLGMASPGTPETMTSDGASQRLSLAPSISSSSSIVGNDPYYNPPFPNDVHIKERTGWNKFLHFAKKHSDDFTTATTSYFMSHIEFGGCLADFSGLKKRYARIRALEDVDDTTDEAINEHRRRIRFVNYYTASTGILKPANIQNVSVKGADEQMTALTQSTSQLNVSGHEGERTSEESQIETPLISIEEHREGEVVPKRVKVNTIGETTEDQTESSYFPRAASPEPAEPAMKVVKQQISGLGPASGVRRADTGDDELAPMRMADAMPIMSDEEDYEHHDQHHHSENGYHDVQDKTKHVEMAANVSSELTHNAAGPPSVRAPSPLPIPCATENTLAAPEPKTPLIIRTPPTEPAFPPLPSVPDEPAPFNPADYEDKDARKIAEKDHKRLVKQYATAVKDRENALKDREKMRLKREKKAKEEAERIRKQEERERERQRKFEEKGRQVEEQMTQKTGEQLRLEREALRMENEGRRMRNEPPLDRMPAATSTKHAKLQKSRSPSPSPSMPSLAQTESVVSQTPSTSTSTTATKEEKAAKKKKDRRFCLLPNDLTRSKEIDKCWVRVYMEGVDEVGAHCGLFFQGQQYESLVGDVGERIGTWVREDATRRMVTEYRNVD